MTKPGQATGLSERSLGWLRYLHRKAHTADNWNRHGRPHPHWDDRSDPPVGNKHRSDLVDSALAMGLMAHRTPAWTEPHVAVLDALIDRHTGWWSAADWLTQFGNDPARGGAPDAYRSLVPAERWGSYDLPGWAANGVEPWGVQMDPVAASGMTSYKGFFLVLLGIRSMIDPTDRWNEPFEMIRDGADSFTWTHTAIAEVLTDQWLATPTGPHCENTKVWPSQLLGAGLGLRLHDNRHGSDLHRRAVEPWWRVAREQDLDLDGDGPPMSVTLYSDPTLGFRHQVDLATVWGQGAALAAAFHAAPQFPDDARRLFDAAVVGIASDDRPLPVSRHLAMALLLAREWELDDLAERLVGRIEASCEPTWDRDAAEFTWGMGLDEPHPRGQYNAVLAAAEAAGPVMWERLSAAPLEPCPQLVDVDFPDMSFSRAEWIDGNLHLRLAPRVEDPNKSTHFRIVGAEPRNWETHGLSGASGVRLELTMRGLNVTVPMVAGDLTFIRSSY